MPLITLTLVALSILPNFCLTVSRASVRAGFPALVSCWHIIIFLKIFSCQLINLIEFDLKFGLRRAAALVSSPIHLLK